MIIHFICTGNTYRSRMAETYLRSKLLPGIKVISSGTHAANNLNGSIQWVAARIILNNNLMSFISPTWNQTSKELIDQSDFLIFMSREHYDYCVKYLNYNGRNYQIWNIDDIDLQFALTGKALYQNDIKLIKQSEKTFIKIKQKIDQLIISLNLNKVNS